MTNGGPRKIRHKAVITVPKANKVAPATKARNPIPRERKNAMAKRNGDNRRSNAPPRKSKTNPAVKVNGQKRIKTANTTKAMNTRKIAAANASNARPIPRRNRRRIPPTTNAMGIPNSASVIPTNVESASRKSINKATPNKNAINPTKMNGNDNAQTQSKVFGMKFHTISNG